MTFPRILSLNVVVCRQSYGGVPTLMISDLDFYKFLRTFRGQEAKFYIVGFPCISYLTHSE